MTSSYFGKYVKTVANSSFLNCIMVRCSDSGARQAYIQSQCKQLLLAEWIFIDMIQLFILTLKKNSMNYIT